MAEYFNLLYAIEHSISGFYRHLTDCVVTYKHVIVIISDGVVKCPILNVLEIVEPLNLSDTLRINYLFSGL